MDYTDTIGAVILIAAFFYEKILLSLIAICVSSAH